MNRSYAILLGLVLASGWLEKDATAQSRINLAKDGQALQPIIISSNASEGIKSAADELAQYLQQITGAKFEVQPGDGSHGIVLGSKTDFPNPVFAHALVLRNTYDGREAYVIRSERNRLWLIGGTDLGASHAAFRLLEKIGCRWLFPAKAWEIVPTERRLSISINETDRPRILARRIWYGYGFFSDKGHPLGKSAKADYDDWARHNRMASSFRVHASHAWENVILANQPVFREHLEFLALVNGKRTGPQMCVSQPAVRKMAVEYALNYFRKKPDLEMVSMETSDGSDHCECQECRKLGSVDERAFGLANEVARAVAREFPGKMVGHLAYNDHCEPPAFPLEPNLYVQLTAGFIRGRYTHEELIDLWSQKTRNLGFYEYFSVWLWDFDKLPGGNGANIERIQKMIRRYAQAGATSFDAESGNNWGPHGRGYYIANKLLWNPDANVNALLEDFYENAFGPAAIPMQRYYDRVAPENKPLLSRNEVGQAFRDLQQATQLAARRPDVLARLDQIKHYLRYVHLRWLLDNEPDKAKRKDLTLAALTLGYRTRYEYMNHWRAMQSDWAEKAAKEFNEPAWSQNDRSRKPWESTTSLSAQETEGWFQEGLDYFKVQPVRGVRFSDDLVPAHFDDARGGSTQQQFQGSARYAFLSSKGEPLEFEITPGVIAWYRDRPDARFTLKDPKDRVISESRLKLDGTNHPVSLNVPRPGTWWFTFDDSSAGWRIKASQDHAPTLVLERGRLHHHMGHMPEMFFYVPKGTRTLQYFWSGAPHKVFRPDGKLAHEEKRKGEIVAISVPEGMDGKCWSFRELQLEQLWFFNAPNCLGAAPNTLLLPRELVKRDGLRR